MVARPSTVAKRSAAASPAARRPRAGRTQAAPVRRSAKSAKIKPEREAARPEQGAAKPERRERGGFPGPLRVGFSVFHDSASGDSHANGSLPDATFAVPADTRVGDFMLVLFGADHALQNLAPEDLAPSGWTLYDQHENYGGDGQGMYLLYKFVEASDPNPIVFAGINGGTGYGVQGLLSVYRGVNATAPVNAYEPLVQDTGSDSVKSIVTLTPELTTSVDDCLLVAGLSPDTAIDAPRITSWPEGFDLDRVSVTNPPTPYPFGWANIYSADRQQRTAGTVGASAFAWDMTYGGTLYYGAASFVLALAP